MVRLIDRIPMVSFGKEKYFYYRVDDIIAWHKKELAESNGHSGIKNVLEALLIAKDKWLQQKVKA